MPGTIAHASQKLMMIVRINLCAASELPAAIGRGRSIQEGLCGDKPTAATLRHFQCTTGTGYFTSLDSALMGQSPFAGRSGG
jgi:hypothetical protein